jgi:hypothetical protein
MSNNQKQALIPFVGRKIMCYEFMGNKQMSKTKEQKEDLRKR